MSAIHSRHPNERKETLESGVEIPISPWSLLPLSSFQRTEMLGASFLCRMIPHLNIKACGHVWKKDSVTISQCERVRPFAHNARFTIGCVLRVSKTLVVK